MPMPAVLNAHDGMIRELLEFSQPRPTDVPLDQQYRQLAAALAKALTVEIDATPPNEHPSLFTTLRLSARDLLLDAFAGVNYYDMMLLVESWATGRPDIMSHLQTYRTRP